jgi:hypothetical protein
MILPADWAGLGQNAGLVRNAEIAANADRLVSFLGRRQPGDGEPGPAGRRSQAADRNTWPPWHTSARRTGFARRSPQKQVNFIVVFGRLENIP